MPVDLIPQLEMAGRLLDRLAPPLTIDDVAPIDDRRAADPVERPDEAVTVELAALRPHSSQSWRTTWFGVAAASALVVAGVAALSRRDSDSAVPQPSASGPSVASTDLEAGDGLPVDPRFTVDWPADAFPAGAVLRLSAELGRFGQVWVYDAPATGEVCVVRQTDDGYSGCSEFNAETYLSGQAWSLEGVPQSQAGAVLWGLAPVDLPVTVVAGDTVVASDANGLWYMEFPPDASGFTIQTPTATYTPDVVLEPVQTTIVVTSTTADIGFVAIDPSGYIPAVLFSANLSDVNEVSNDVTIGNAVVTTRRSGDRWYLSFSVEGVPAGSGWFDADPIRAGVAFMEVGVPGRRFVVGLVPDEITIVKVNELNTAPVDNVYFFDITGVDKAVLSVSDGVNTAVVGGDRAPTTP
jgi:hypothetical protein